MYELSLTEHVMMSSNQLRLAIFVVLADNYSAGLLTPEITVILFTLQIKPTWRNKLRCLVIKIFQEDQLNFRRFPVFPGAVDALR